MLHWKEQATVIIFIKHIFTSSCAQPLWPAWEHPPICGVCKIACWTFYTSFRRPLILDTREHLEQGTSARGLFFPRWHLSADITSTILGPLSLRLASFSFPIAFSQSSLCSGEHVIFQKCFKRYLVSFYHEIYCLC